MDKPLGWMDHPHDTTRSRDEVEFLRTYRTLTPEQRDHLAATAALLSKSNGSGPPAPPPTVVPFRKH
jgi:hypothetical protein